MTTPMLFCVQCYITNTQAAPRHIVPVNAEPLTIYGGQLLCTMHLAQAQLDNNVKEWSK